MDREPLVSIVMPAFNVAPYVMAAVNSVLSQTWQRWELIIVNDGSTDETGAILQGLGDDRITVIEQDNGGVSAARNAGLGRAKGDFITFMDADDVLPPESIRARARFLADNPGIDIVDGKIVSKDERLEKVVREYSPYYRGPLLPRLLALDDRVFFGTVYMVRRPLLEGMSFPHAMSHAEDLLFFTLVADKRELQYAFVEEEVYHYRTRYGSATSDIRGLQEGYVRFMRSIFSCVSVSFLEKVRLRLKISKIMFLSWVDAGDYRNAFASIYQIISCR